MKLWKSQRRCRWLNAAEDVSMRLKMSQRGCRCLKEGEDRSAGLLKHVVP